MTSLREVMAKDPITVGPDATLAAAAAVMTRARVGSLLVVDDDVDDVVGIVTERDVLRAAGADGDLMATRVRDWMTREPTTAPADQTIDDAVTTMLDGGFRHLPVTEDDRVIGIVSLRALFSAHIGGASRAPADGPSSDPVPDASPAQVQERRERLYEATRGLREHSRSPVDDADAWRDELGTAVDVLADVVAAHIAATEQPDGFFAELVRESQGRLSAAVRRLGREHERSNVMLDDLRAAIDANADPAELRQAADELYAQLEAHRHRGSDLLWQAYGTEIGGDG